MSEETPLPPRYRLLRQGVRDEYSGAEFDATSNPEAWAEYISWLQSGNTPLPMIVAPRDPDRSYYTNAGIARQERQLAKLSDEEFLTQLRKGIV